MPAFRFKYSSVFILTLPFFLVWLDSVALGATLLHQYFLPPFSSPLLSLSTFSHLRWEWVLVGRQ
jgi:hypothetical protein